MPTLLGKTITQNGLGVERMTRHTDPLPDEQSLEILKAAVAAGVNIWVGADFYGTPENNSLHLFNRYFTKYPEDADRVVICIKSGLVSMKTFTMDCSPEAMRKCVENANRILDGKKKLDIFGPARVDPNVPIEETVRGLAKLVAEGKIGGIQLSEVSAPIIRRAAKVAKIEMTESEVSLCSTDVFQNGTAEACAALGIHVVAHSPLSGGMLSGRLKSLDDLPENDHHRFFPRFQPENFQKNLKLVEALNNFALAKGCTTPQLALSWTKAHSKMAGMPLIIPAPGASSEERLLQNCKDVDLTVEDLVKIKEILEMFPVFGGRYPPMGMKLVQ